MEGTKMTNPIFIPTRAVAALLEMTTAEFLRRRETLERDHAFPAPLPWRGQPYSWRAAEVTAWLDADVARPAAPIDPALLASGQVAMLREAAR
jgi:predicted DNA-binding transcriptional regulator AlpA